MKLRRRPSKGKKEPGLQFQQGKPAVGQRILRPAWENKGEAEEPTKTKEPSD
ncbi:MAG: hypothetical protein GXX99_02995 [Clostridiales bacterium]|nr:hypothetical protein [Clostridiales bacterium]